MEGAFRPGAILVGKYRIESPTVRDGICAVLAVTHLQVGRDRRFRMVMPEPASSLSVHARFLREAQLAAHLRGGCVARIVDVGLFANGAPYLVMEHPPGADLAGELVRRGALAPGEAVDCLLQACEAVAEAHALGIVHRDIKPSNLWLVPRPDGPPAVKLLDIGISKALVAVEGPLNRTDAVMGTPGYMAPEQRRPSDEIDGRADIWALGVVLYECLTGARAFPTAPGAPPGRGGGPSGPRPMDFRIPQALQHAVQRCLETDREARYPIIADLVAALAPHAHDVHAAAGVLERVNLLAQGADAVDAVYPPGQTPLLPPVSGTIAPMSRSRRRYATIAAVAAAVTIGGIALAAVVRPSRSHGASGEAAAAGAATAAAAGTAAATPAAPARTPAAPVAPAAPTAPTAAPTTPTAAPTTTTAAAATTTAAAATTTAAATAPAAPATAAAKPVDAAAKPIDAAAKPAEAAAKPIDAAAKPAAASAAAASAPATAAAGSSRDAERSHLLGRCNDLLGDRQWQAAETCAQQLAELGGDSQAQRIRGQARQEHRNQGLGDQVRQALRDGDLQSAQSTLTLISGDSVYLPQLRDSFASAEHQRTDDVRRKAQALAAAHDCAGLKRFIAQLTGNATDRIVASARTVSCDEPTASADPALDRAARVTEPPPSPRPRKDSCESVDVADLMTRAATQYDAGSPSSALSLTRVALGCKQTDRMYWLAVMYACAAHDVANARQYFPKVPANLQSGIEHKCQQANLDVRSR